MLITIIVIIAIVIILKFTVDYRKHVGDIIKQGGMCGKYSVLIKELDLSIMSDNKRDTLLLGESTLLYLKVFDTFNEVQYTLLSHGKKVKSFSFPHSMAQTKMAEEIITKLSVL